MKYFLFFFLTTTPFYCQTGKITYSSILNFEGSKEKQTKSELFFTNNASFYRSQVKTDKKTENDENSEDSESGKVVEMNITVGTDSKGNVYYRNLQSRNIICREAIFRNPGLKYYIYEDATNIKWQLLDEFKEISGYKCQKAITAFRGRMYEAWFASEIPLSFGPWKFSGLPGLILEVYDQTGEVYFSAEHIQIPYSNAEKIVQKPSGDPTIDYREFIEKQDGNSAKITQAILARAPKGSTLVSSKTIKKGIELEHPWEKE